MTLLKIFLNVLGLVMVNANALCEVNAPFQPARDLDADRAACTKKCNDDGYCCNTNSGGCENLTCSMGCHMAWFSDSVAECKAKCQAGNGNGCVHFHTASIDGVEYETTFYKCWGGEGCGCPASTTQQWGPSNDCSAQACEAGCEKAAYIELHSFYGREFTESEIQKAKEASDIGATSMLNQLQLISDRIGGQDITLDDLEDYVNTLNDNKLLFKKNPSLLEKAFSVIEIFENTPNLGPLWIGQSGDIGRANDDFFNRNNEDGLNMSRVVMHLMQLLIDEVYNAPENVLGECSKSLFEGKGWRTAKYFPGFDLSSTPATSNTITKEIYANFHSRWGRPSAYAELDMLRPLGLFLAPGTVGSIEVPSAMVAKGYKIQVGSHTVDNSNKNNQKRMDRVTTLFPIMESTTLVSNPLGGNLYILVPHQADVSADYEDGVVDVKVNGKFVQSPHFRYTFFDQMSDEEWKNVRGYPGPHADFETDTFLLNVPRNWIYNFDSPMELMQKYNYAMEGTALWLGYPPVARQRHILFLQPDFHIKHGAYGIGYPQVNTIVNTPYMFAGQLRNNNYNGDNDHWLLRNPMGSYVCWHELGHETLLSFYRGEVEAINNFLLTYIEHVQFGKDFDDSFARGLHDYWIPDDAAMHWMITPNFRDGNQMDHSNTEFDEFRYQQRGYAKYADIVRLFGWEAFTEFYYQENVFYQQYGVERHRITVRPADDRTLHFSKAANCNVMPLIEFWGIFPEDEPQLLQEINDAGLQNCEQVRCLLKRYRDEVIPKNNEEFNELFERIYPGRWVTEHDDKRYGRGWFGVWRNLYSETEATAGQQRIDVILNKFYNGKQNDSCAGIKTGAKADGDYISRELNYQWLTDFNAETTLKWPGGRSQQWWKPATLQENPTVADDESTSVSNEEDMDVLMEEEQTTSPPQWGNGPTQTDSAPTTTTTTVTSTTTTVTATTTTVTATTTTVTATTTTVTATTTTVTATTTTTTDNESNTTTTTVTTTAIPVVEETTTILPQTTTTTSLPNINSTTTTLPQSTTTYPDATEDSAEGEGDSLQEADNSEENSDEDTNNNMEEEQVGEEIEEEQNEDEDLLFHDEVSPNEDSHQEDAIDESMAEEEDNIDESMAEEEETDASDPLHLEEEVQDDGFMPIRPNGEEDSHQNIAEEEEPDQQNNGFMAKRPESGEASSSLSMLLEALTGANKEAVADVLVEALLGSLENEGLEKSEKTDVANTVINNYNVHTNEQPVLHVNNHIGGQTQYDGAENTQIDHFVNSVSNKEEEPKQNTPDQAVKPNTEEDVVNDPKTLKQKMGELGDQLGELADEEIQKRLNGDKVEEGSANGALGCSLLVVLFSVLLMF